MDVANLLSVCVIIHVLSQYIVLLEAQDAHTVVYALNITQTHNAVFMHDQINLV